MLIAQPSSCLSSHQTRHARSRVSSRARASTSTTLSTALTLQQYDDFELLWLEYRHGLSISKAAATTVLQDAQQGRLPADAELLRARAQQFADLRRQLPQLDTMHVLNSSITDVLKHDSGQLRQAVLKLLQLLPSCSPTELVLDTVADLQQLPAEVIALQYQEMGLLFRTALGAPIRGPAFHHLLGHLQLHDKLLQQQQQRQQQQEKIWAVAENAAQPQQQQPEPAAPKQQQQQQQQQHEAQATTLAAPAAVLEQLQALNHLLGAELASAVLHTTPQLLSTPLQRVTVNLQWLQWRLRLTPVAALLLAEKHGDLLLLPPAQLQANYDNLCYLLQHLLGWRLQQVHTLLCNAPQLLVADGKQLAGRWQKVQQCCRRRRPWELELAAAGPALATAVLGCQAQQLLMLQYAADTRDLRGKRLIQVLADVQYVDFIKACPGFRMWRAMGPGRWWFAAGGAAASANGAISRAADGGGAVRARDSSSGGSSREQAAERVLAVDESGRPTLVRVVGERGPYGCLV